MNAESAQKIIIPRYIQRSDLLAEHKQVMEELANAEQIARTNRLQLATLKNERDEFEKQYQMLSDLHSQCRPRETIHFAKIQESVNLAEAAIKERDAAIDREKEIRGSSGCEMWEFVQGIDYSFHRGMRSLSIDHWPRNGRSRRSS